MDANGLKFRMLSRKQDWPLQSSVNSGSAAAASVSSLAQSVGVAETQLVLLTPLQAGAPQFVSIDAEVMLVNAIDPTGLQLGVTRGAWGTAAANHPPGALVLGAVGILRLDAAAADPKVIVMAPSSSPAAAPAGLAAGIFLEIGSETLIVAGIDSTGMVLSVTRGALGTAAAPYAAGTPVFEPFPLNTLSWCSSTGRLQLASMRLGNPPLESFTAASALVETVPMTRDTFGNYARWDPAARKVLAGGSGPGEAAIYQPPAGQAVTGLAMGYDGILYVAAGGSLMLVDRRGRWLNFTLSVPGFTFWRLASLPRGGVLALDRTTPQLGRVDGAPLPTAQINVPDAGVLRSCQANPTPPRMAVTYPLPAAETFVGLSVADNSFLLLSWAAASEANTASYLRIFDTRKGLAAPWTLKDILWPYSLGWLGESKAAVLATGLREALIFDLSEPGVTLLATGDTYVLAALNSGPFANCVSQPPYYAAGNQLLAPVPLAGSRAAITVTSLAPGSHRIRALYGGDGSHPAQASPVVVQTVAAPSGVTLSTSVNPSLTGQSVTFAATVVPPGATGTVQFQDGTTALGPGTISGGVATLSLSTLPVGEHSITAFYSGDATHPPRTSAALAQSVAPAVAPVGLTSAPNPSVPGQAVTFTVQVSPATATGSVQFTDGEQLLPLLPLSLNSLAGFGTTDPRSPAIVDSGLAQTVWHRVFLEAILPQRCSVVVWLTAAEQPAGVISPAAEWFPHAFGDADMSALPTGSPRGVWLSIASEVPFAKPLLGETPIPDRQGLFMALAQRTGRVVRNLTGRFLGIRVELHGDRRSTPAIAALRVWSPRFSYVRNYLPAPYKENKFSPAADQAGPSTRRDFFERFVTVFEAQMTRIEDRVASSYLLTRPEATPDSALDWLGSWVGLSPAGYPQDRRRARLLAASKLHRQRGTVAGVTLALDIATNGLCSRGAVVVLEDFRLRHIFATILGANLAIQTDPLLPGYSGSSNSIVGDTLFLGDPADQAEILALFSADLPESDAEQATVQQFYDSLANRMTVFVHNQVDAVDLNLVQRIVEHEKPAHVAATVRAATQPFLVGLAALLGVDSYLAPVPPPGPVVLGTSQIGRYNRVTETPASIRDWRPEAMATDSLNPLPAPQRVYYSTGRMLGVADFQADQDYHRGRLARALVQLCGTGTVAGLMVLTDKNADPAQLELQVTPGVAIDRLGRIIEVPRLVCIVLNNWLTQEAAAWESQVTTPVPGQTAIPDPNTAIHDGQNLMCDLFATFVPCKIGATPTFAAEDDYDATNAFSANRWLDSFAMQLVLRTDLKPLTPVDPWHTSGTIATAGSTLIAPSTAALQNLILTGTAGLGVAPVEYPHSFDATSVFLARILIAATAGAAGQPPTWDLAKISIDNNSRLFVYPSALLSRLGGLASGTEV